MAKKFMSLRAVVAVIGGGALLFGQGGTKAGERTLTLEDKNYSLPQALAYETTVNGEDAGVSGRETGKTVHRSRPNQSQFFGLDLELTEINRGEFS